MSVWPCGKRPMAGEQRENISGWIFSTKFGWSVDDDDDNGVSVDSDDDEDDNDNFDCVSDDMDDDNDDEDCDVDDTNCNGVKNDKDYGNNQSSKHEYNKNNEDLF